MTRVFVPNKKCAPVCLAARLYVAAEHVVRTVASRHDIVVRCEKQTQRLRHDVTDPTGWSGQSRVEASQIEKDVLPVLPLQCPLSNAGLSEARVRPGGHQTELVRVDHARTEWEPAEPCF